MNHPSKTLIFPLRHVLHTVMIKLKYLRVMKTKLMYHLYSVYFVNEPLHVSGIFVAHYQGLYCVYIIGNFCAF